MLLLKVIKVQSPRRLFSIITATKRAYMTRNDDELPHFKVKHNYFKNCFFSSTVIGQNKLDVNIHNSKSLTTLKGNIVKFTRPSEKSTFLGDHPKVMQLLTGLRLGLSHIRNF